MKRAVLLILVLGLTPACDDISNPPERPVPVTATVEGGGQAIGAVLLSVAGTADSVAVTGGKGLASTRGGRTYVAAVLSSPASTVTIGMRVRGEAIASIEVIRVSDGDDEPYADAGAFTVTAREE